MDTKDEVGTLKRKILEAVKGDLSAQAFEVPGSATAMISACAELLISFSLGNQAERGNLSPEEKRWWQDLCESLRNAAD